MKAKLNASQYNVASSDSLSVRLAHVQRRKMFEAFIRAMEPQSTDRVLDVGATGDRSYCHSNYLESWYRWKECLTATGIDSDAAFLQEEYAGLRFVLADGRSLPFRDRTFDFVHSSAVLEHVGSRTQQVRFLGEIWRVARRGIFVTTPNRWFPVEFHTMLPLVHWLPAAVFRRLLNCTGRAFFAREENLNLLSPRTLASAVHEAGIDSYRISTVEILGWPTNLLLTAKR